ncbi:MAG: DUF302 domain-containing protein [Bacteroidales bacterium]|jgi:uncharacterized protein (DUF302 family)|nr:DUF302 domain-containing protein [Bacteroidales bacterium]
MKTTKIKLALIMLVIVFASQIYAQDKAASMVSRQMEGKYYTAIIVDTDFETTIENVKAALKEQGFGVVSEIDMQEKLQKGTGNDVPKYTILGACNPDGAYQALQLEEQIGVMLPCNVIVRETSTGQVEVAAINPQKTMQSIGNPNMIPLAAEISEKLKNVLSGLENR